MTRLYRIYVGLANVEHTSHAGTFLELADSKAIRTFGGFSRSFVFGGYRDGHDYYEKSVVYEIVTDKGKSIAYFAGWLRGTFHQKTVLVTAQDVDATFL